MFITIDTNTDDNTGSIIGGATHIDVYNHGSQEASIIIDGQTIPIPTKIGWSSGYRSSGFSNIRYNAQAGSRLIIIAWD